MPIGTDNGFKKIFLNNHFVFLSSARWIKGFGRTAFMHGTHGCRAGIRYTDGKGVGL